MVSTALTASSSALVKHVASRPSKMDLPFASVAPTNALYIVNSKILISETSSDGNYCLSHSRRTMANSRSDLTSPKEFTSKSDVDRISSKVQDGSMSANIEDGIIILDVHLAEFLGRSEFGFDSLVLEELDRFVIFEHLSNN